MNTQAINSNLLARLKDKKYRDLFISSQINRIIPFQIRALRAARDNMTQEELAERAETTQSVISRIQNKGAANLNIKSLLKLASAFDVALVVRFEPIDGFINWVDDLSPKVMTPRPSEEVLEEAEQEAHEQTATSTEERSTGTSAPLLRPVPVKNTPPVIQQSLPFNTSSSFSIVRGTRLERNQTIKGESTKADLTIGKQKAVAGGR